MIISQVGIAIFGAAAVFLANEKRESRRKWASILGMAGQPFWFAEAYSNQQWGVLALTVLYTWFWWRGIRNFWLQP